jgi:hypothetical protein
MDLIIIDPNTVTSEVRIIAFRKFGLLPVSHWGQQNSY